jgi:hypothetical protein
MRATRSINGYYMLPRLHCAGMTCANADSWWVASLTRRAPVLRHAHMIGAGGHPSLQSTESASSRVCVNAPKGQAGDNSANQLRGLRWFITSSGGRTAPECFRRKVPISGCLFNRRRKLAVRCGSWCYVGDRADCQIPLPVPVPRRACVPQWGRQNGWQRGAKGSIIRTGSPICAK